jgi:hypothetical protein
MFWENSGIFNIVLYLMVEVYNPILGKIVGKTSEGPANIF